MFVKNFINEFAWHSATDVTIQLESAKTRSAICFSATYQEGQRAQRAGGEVDIGWGHLWKDLLLFLESGYKLHVYSSHWVWLLGCSFALDRDSEYKLHCERYLAHWENPHYLSQKKSQPHRFLVQQNFETGMNPQRRVTSPLRQRFSHSKPISGQWERWRRKEPPNNRRGNKSFAWIPQLKLFDTDRFWAVFPQSLVVVWKNFEFSRSLLVQWRSRKGKVAPRPVENPRTQIPWEKVNGRAPAKSQFALAFMQRD